jgi:hypothetical protein
MAGSIFRHLGKPHPAERQARRPHGAEYRRRTTASCLCEHRAEHERRPAADAVGSGTAAAADDVNSKDNPDANCLPIGFLQLHTHSQPRKIVQTNDDLVIMYESNYGLRNIFTDGRPLPANDPQPWWYGYSAGKYDGDTLVVETIGLRDNGWLDVNGAPFTSAAKITERFRRPTYGRMEIDVTVDDAKAYTRPWTVHVNWRLGAEEELIEFICNENERDAKRLR